MQPLLWLLGLRVYLGVVLVGSLVWEVLHLPLYSIWTAGTLREQAFAAGHCTLGDLVIAACALTLALLLGGAPRWPRDRFWPIATLTVAFGLAYTVFSEWLNVAVRACLDLFRLDADRFHCRLENRSLASAAVDRGAGCRICHHAAGNQPDLGRTIMNRIPAVAIAMLALTALPQGAMAQPGAAARGERMYRACAPCHSLEPNRNMTGPSLADVWNRKSGSLGSFPRYSPALKSAGIVWNDDTLDQWIKDPLHFIPGNTMTFPGIKDARQRADLLAFLKDATRPGHAPKTAQGGNQMGGMMMGGGAVPNLKTLDPEDRVRSINHCGDTYKVTTADGKIRDFWERNLRFKTDVSDEGPQKGAPALVGAGMMGDRADVIFASPDEISGFIAHQC